MRSAIALVLSCLAAVSLWAASAQATPVGTKLVDSVNSLQVEDKLFNNFTCTIGTNTGFSSPGSCENITITPLASTVAPNTNPGIMITGGFSAVAGGVLGSNSVVDVALTFAVT